MTGRQVRLLVAAGALLVVFAVLALFVAVGGQAVPGPDRWVADHLFAISADHDWVASAARGVGMATEPTVLRALALCGVVWLLVRGRRRAALWLVVTMAAGALLGIGAKLVYTRPRPVWETPITAIDGYSFPSGHATNSMIFAGCVLVLVGASLGRSRRVWLRAGLAALVIVTGLDRMLLGVHFLSDVVAGWAFGAAVVLVMAGLWPPVPLVTVLPDPDPPSPHARASDPSSRAKP